MILSRSVQIELELRSVQHYVQESKAEEEEMTESGVCSGDIHLSRLWPSFLKTESETSHDQYFQ